MANRHIDWLKQADADLRHSEHALDAGHFEWACFSAQQAAEKAIKSVFLKHGRDASGHTLSILLGNLGELAPVPDELVERAKVLDKHYIPTRYPNGFDAGAPTDFYTRGEAVTAVDYARSIIAFCRDQVH